MTIDPATISATTALVAVVVSPIVSVYVAKRQIRASVVSANRQAWINQLRDTLAELVTSFRFLNARRDGDIALDQHEWLERFQRAFQLSMKVALLLNLAEADHRELDTMIKEAIGLPLSSANDRSQQLIALTQRIVEQSQAILKREWERVKSGD